MNFKLKQNILALTLLTCSATAFVGCSSSAKPAAGSETNKSIAGTEKTDKQTAPTASSDAPKDSAVAAGDDKIGVAECDDYIQKYEACVTGKVPESARSMIQTSFEQTRKSWKDIAANPQAKSSLASACRQAKDMAKQSMGAYHCDW